MRSILLAATVALLAAVPTRAVDLAPRDPVIGLALVGVQRAYPLSTFSAAPVVNDEVAHLAVLVFYDHDSDIAVAYFRLVAGEPLEFSGNAAGMVADDLTTATRWDLATGKAVGGSLIGQKLIPIPVKRFPLDDWQKAFPKGTLFSP